MIKLSKNPANPNPKKGKTPMKSRRQILMDLASSLQGPATVSTTTSASTSNAGSIDLFSSDTVDPDTSAVPNSTASEEDDDSVADKYYNPDKSR